MTEQEEDLPLEAPQLARYFSLGSELDETPETDDNRSFLIGVQQLSNIVQEGNDEINALTGKDVVLIIGKTGVGKSSLIQMIHGVKLQRAEDRTYKPVNEEILLEDFEIGNSQNSQTKSVRAYHYLCNSSDPLVFCDMPGYKDTKTYQIDIATSVWINQIAKVCKSLRFVFMIHGATLEEDKGQLFRDLMELLTKLVKNEPLKVAQGMLILFTHMSDQFNEERDEEVVLKYINEKITAIEKATTSDKNLFMRLLRTFITKKTGHLRVLNPVTTNISELIHFIRNTLKPLQQPDQLVQCSFSREVGLAVNYAMANLDTAISDALISSLIEKQQNLPELIRLYFIFVSMLQTAALKSSASRLIADVMEEYVACKTSVLKIVDSTVQDKASTEIIGKEEVLLIIPKYNKLKLLNPVLQELSSNFCLNSLEREEQFNQSLFDNIANDDIFKINMEYHRKCLLMKIDIIGKIMSALDYSLVFQQLQNLLALSNLDETIGGLDEKEMQSIQIPDIITLFFNIIIPIAANRPNLLKADFLMECHHQLCNNAIPQFHYLFDLCFHRFYDIVNVSLTDLDHVTSEVLSKLLESFENDLRANIQDALAHTQRKSLNDLSSDLQQHVVSLQETLLNIVSQNNILDNTQLTEFFHNVQRVRSFYHLSSPKFDLIETFDESPATDIDFLNQLDQHFKTCLLETFDSVKLGLFKEDKIPQFLLLVNKMELFLFHSSAKTWFPGSRQVLDDLKREIEENKRNRELVSSLSTQLQRKDQEILVLKDQLSSREDSLRNSEKRILELTNEKKQAIARNDKLEKELLKEKEKFDNQMKVLSKQLNSSQSTNRDQEEQLKEMIKKMETKDQLLVEKETLLTNLRDELSRCEFQLGELKTKLECSENEIANLREELEAKGNNLDIFTQLGIDESYLRNLQELKNMVVERFQYQRVVELNNAKLEKYMELNEKIKKTKDRRTLISLNSELESLNYDPNNNSMSLHEGSDLELLERIVTRAKALYEELHAKEKQFMIEKDFESSMLCEVDRLNLLNLLKIFEVEANLEDGNINNHEYDQKDQLISTLREQIATLNEAFTLKEEELKEKQSIITRFESKLGIGLKEPHVRVESFNINTISNSGIEVVDGTYRRLGQDIPCKLKIAINPLQHSHLERERRILETIRRNDTHGQQSQFIVTLLNSEEFLTDESENLYFFTKEGELSPPSSRLFSSPMKSLVFESGGLNLKQFMQKNRLSVPVIQRVQILGEINRALEFLHDLGIVHFDLKPENVVSFSSLSTSNLRWKLIDFDTSYDVSSSHSNSSSNSNQSPIMIRYPSNNAATAAIRVTEEYMSPEIMRILNPNPDNQDTSVPVDVEVSWRIDIWSLGMIGVFLLSNYSLWDLMYPTVPFQNTMVLTVSQEKIQLSYANSPSIGTKEKSFLDSCLQVDGAKRMKASGLLQKSLFKTDLSTVHSNLFQRSGSETLIVELQRMINQIQEESLLTRSSMSEDMEVKLRDVRDSLSAEMERIRFLDPHEG